MRLFILISKLKKNKKILFQFPLKNISMTGTDLFFYVFNLEENLKKINILKKEVKVSNFI